MATCLDSRAFSQTNMCRSVIIHLSICQTIEEMRTIFTSTPSLQQCCGAESWGADMKLPSRAWAEIMNCGSGSSSVPAPAPFCLPQTLRNFIEKNHGCWKSFETCYNLIFKVYFKTIRCRSRGWSRFRNSDLRLLGAGAEKIFLASKHCLTESLSRKWKSKCRCFLAAIYMQVN